MPKEVAKQGAPIDSKSVPNGRLQGYRPPAGWFQQCFAPPRPAVRAKPVTGRECFGAARRHPGTTPPRYALPTSSITCDHAELSTADRFPQCPAVRKASKAQAAAGLARGSFSCLPRPNALAFIPFGLRWRAPDVPACNLVSSARGIISLPAAKIPGHPAAPTALRNTRMRQMHLWLRLVTGVMTRSAACGRNARAVADRLGRAGVGVLLAWRRAGANASRHRLPVKNILNWYVPN